MNGATVGWMLERLDTHAYDGGLYDGGLGGTCYRCPFASEPQTSGGSPAAWHNISHDPTAEYNCHLPGRDGGGPEWGEYAPCTASEWVDAVKSALPKLALHVIVRPRTGQVDASELGKRTPGADR